MIRGILFDFDGTLVDSNQCKADGFYEVISDIPDAAQHMRAILADPEIGDRTQIFAALTRRLLPAEEAELRAGELIAAYTRLTEARVGIAPKRAGALSALDGLRTMGLPIGISSATPRETLKAILVRQQLAPYFRDTYGAPESKVEHIAAFSQELSCAPEQLAYVGDSEVDRVAAAAMGCHFIAVGDDWDRFAAPPSDLMSDLSALPERIAATPAS